MASKTIAVTAWEALFRAQVTVMRLIGSEFPSEEMSLTEYDVLFNLSRQPERRLRIRDLGKDLLLSQPSVSRMVDRLAARGLITKSPDPTDARGIIVALSDDGLTLFRRVAKVHIDSIATHVSHGLNNEELLQLTALCNKLREGVLAGEQGRPGAL